MQKFFVRACDIENGLVIVKGSDGRHISRSLRMAKGDPVTVCDMQRREYDCVIEDFTGPDRTDVVLRIVSERDTDTEPPCSVTVYQALPKSDKMDVIVQKAVELGAARVVPVITERIVSRPDERSADKKLERWRRIAKEAAVQCGRGFVPEIGGFAQFGEALDRMSEADVFFLCYEGENVRPLPELISGVNGGHVAFMIGAEGGFSSAEADAAAERGIPLAGLGKRILRCETASGFVLSCLAYETELRGGPENR